MILIGLLASSAVAQDDDGAEPDEVAVEPIRCWWRTDRPAVHLGERFGLTLTCRIVDAAAAAVVLSESQLDPAAVLLTPFEAVGGRRAEDVAAPPYRYVQYEYAVRFLGEGAFGDDVAIPPLTVRYSLQAGTGTVGREQSYVLPALPMRVVSLAPREAADIRDASSDTFAGVQAHRVRSTAALVSAGLFFGFAVVLLGVAGIRVASGWRAARPAAVRPVPALAVLRGCARALQDVKAAAVRDGWSPAHARRAAAVCRLAGAAATGRPIAEAPVNGRGAPREGQLLVRRGLLRRRRALVSAATTPEALAKAIENGEGAAPRVRAAVAPIRDALVVFGAYAYGRHGHPDEAALHAALDEGARAIRRLQLLSVWAIPARQPAVGRRQ